MANFCICDSAVIAKSGYESVSGKMVCRTCGLPDIDSSSSASRVVRNSGEEAVEGDFLQNLFDFKIDNYISVKFSRFIYAISITIYGVLSVIIFFYALANSQWLGGWTLLLMLFSVALFFILSIFARLSVELIVVIFQIARDIRTISGQRPSN